MSHLTLARWFAVAALALVSLPAPAQELSISGNFRMGETYGVIGADLGAVYADGYDHWWRLSLAGASLSQELIHQDWETGYYDERITRVHATSFVFEFFGPDADALNAAVSLQLSQGALAGGAILQFSNVDYFDFDSWDSGTYAYWNVSVQPDDPAAGASFYSGNYWTYPLFPADENGFPLVEPMRLTAYQSYIDDRRPGNGGTIISYYDTVDIGSSVQPPPPPPTVSIQDGSALEGDKGTVKINLQLKLSRTSATNVTVNFATANGTAEANRDYTASSGVVTFLPGETQKTIAVSVKSERKREPDETFTVRLSNPVGATFKRSVATGTIVNDD
ncbi:MAG TPA: Calx-beta domain-containing protein [Planctomycetia bacterium]|nr:Calx-beta domain-containing protein [Planctomycetia bacterium]